MLKEIQTELCQAVRLYLHVKLYFFNHLSKVEMMKQIIMYLTDTSPTFIHSPKGKGITPSNVNNLPILVNELYIRIRRYQCGSEKTLGKQ